MGEVIAYPGAHAAQVASARTAASRSRTCSCEMSRVMNTSRLARFSIGPCGELDRRMREVLHELHHHRSAAPGDVEEAFDAQEIAAAQRHQCLHGARKGIPRQRLLSRSKTKLEMPSLWLASATKPAWLAGGVLPLAPASVRQRGSSEPATASLIAARAD